MAEKGTPSKKPVRLLIKFENEDKLAEWVGYAKDECVIDQDDGVFRMSTLDLDLLKPEGVFVVAQSADRPDELRLKAKRSWEKKEYSV